MLLPPRHQYYYYFDATPSLDYFADADAALRCLIFLMLIRRSY